MRRAALRRRRGDPAGGLRRAPSLASWGRAADRAFLARLPKVELHAHLSGSIRQDTLRQLVQNHIQNNVHQNRVNNHVSSHAGHADTLNDHARHAGTLAVDDLTVDDLTAAVASDGRRSLGECFQLFDVLHALVNSAAVLRRLVIEAVEDFAAENVVYLELRTTPRRDITGIASARSYVVGGMTFLSLSLSLSFSLSFSLSLLSPLSLSLSRSLSLSWIIRYTYLSLVKSVLLPSLPFLSSVLSCFSSFFVCVVSPILL
jgi:hypothetical protein